MIKRSGALFSTRLYIVIALGIALNLYYCGSALAGVKINAPVKSCKMLLTKKIKGCKDCKDKETDVKIKDDKQAESPSFLFEVFGFEIPKISFGDFVLSAQQALLEKLSAKCPPDATPHKTGK